MIGWAAILTTGTIFASYEGVATGPLLLMVTFVVAVVWLINWATR